MACYVTVAEKFTPWVQDRLKNNPITIDISNISNALNVVSCFICNGSEEPKTIQSGGEDASNHPPIPREMMSSFSSIF